MIHAVCHGTIRTASTARRAVLLGLGLVAATATSATAQTVVYRPIVTGFAPAAAPYVANYTPAGNYAAVTAFSPPVMTVAPMAAISTPLPAIVPTSSVAVTSYAPAAMTVVARPVTAAYAPTYASTVTTTAAYAPTAAYSPAGEMFVASAPVAVTAGYAPAPVAVAAPMMAPVAAPVMVPVAPAAVAVPLYRRGPFGGLRPVRGAYWAY